MGSQALPACSQTMMRVDGASGQNLRRIVWFDGPMFSNLVGRLSQTVPYKGLGPGARYVKISCGFRLCSRRGEMIRRRTSFPNRFGLPRVRTKWGHPPEKRGKGRFLQLTAILGPALPPPHAFLCHRRHDLYSKADGLRHISETHLSTANQRGKHAHVAGPKSGTSPAAKALS
jgi:hypothetical protein